MRDQSRRCKTGDLSIGGHRVSGLPARSDNIFKLDRLSINSLNSTNKQYEDDQIAALRSYLISLKILNYNGHIPPLSKNYLGIGFIDSAKSFFSTKQPQLAFNPDERVEIYAHHG